MLDLLDRDFKSAIKYVQRAEEDHSNRLGGSKQPATEAGLGRPYPERAGRKAFKPRRPWPDLHPHPQERPQASEGFP